MSTTAEANPPPLPAPPPRPAANADRGKDFSDRLSPIIVKELRQGLRTRTFVTLFIVVQVLMTLVVVVSLLSAAAGNDATAGTGFFWAMIGIPVLLVMPLRGLGVVSNEIKANTLELVLLTRLSARRIVLGKWLAIVAQTTLFVCAVLPYVVLRYFLGGINLVDDLIGLTLMMIASAIFTAVAVGISPYQNRITKVLLWIGIILGAQMVLPLVFFVGMAGSMMPGVPLVGWASFFAVLALGVLVMALMLEVGAARIAPEAENHSLSQRLLAAAMLLPPLVLLLLGSPVTPVITVLALILIIPTLTTAVCEPVRWNPGIYRGFARRAWIGRLAGGFLTPGWAAGANYTLVMLLAAAALANAVKLFDAEKALMAFTAIAGGILVPAALIRLIVPRTTKPMIWFMGFQTVCLVAVVVVTSIDGILSSSMHVGLAVIPTCGLLVLLGDEIDTEMAANFVVIYGVIVALCFVVLFLQARTAWRRIRELETAARPAVAVPTHARVA